MNKQKELTLDELEMVVGGGKKRMTKEEGCKPNDLSQYNFGRTITPERQIELNLYYAYEEGRLDDAATICRDTYALALQDNNVERAIEYASKEAECHYQLHNYSAAREAYQKGIDLANTFSFKELAQKLKSKMENM